MAQKLQWCLSYGLVESLTRAARSLDLAAVGTLDYRASRPHRPLYVAVRAMGLAAARSHVHMADSAGTKSTTAVFTQVNYYVAWCERKFCKTVASCLASN